MKVGDRRGFGHSILAQRLGFAILTGDHPPSTILPSEIELAEGFGVSRSVIREAIRTLAAKGLVESRPKLGTRVRERSDWNLMDPELLRWMFEGAPPLSFVRSLFQLRMIVEPAAAELAAGSRTAAQLSRMGHELEVMAKRGLATEEGRAADKTFHAIVLEATGNELLVSLSASIAAAVRWTTYFKYRSSRHPPDSMPAHRALFEAIANAAPEQARDAAAKLVRQAHADTELSIQAEEARLGRGPQRATD